MVRLFKVADWSGPHRGHVIFAHGLGGHAYDTWQHGADVDRFWPTWLARDVEGLCAWTLSYNAPSTNWLGTAPPLRDLSVSVLEELLSNREIQGAPIVFVCHSLGGLVVKQLLQSADEQRKSRKAAETLIANVKAAVFIATPHVGSDQANWLEFARFVAWPSSTARDLVRNSAGLRHLNIWYLNWSGAIAHKVFFEMTGMAVGKVVDPSSAHAGLQGVPVGIDRDHVQICKPADRSDLLYKSTRSFVVDHIRPQRDTATYGHEFVEHPRLGIKAKKNDLWVPALVRVAAILLVSALAISSVNGLTGAGSSLNRLTPEEKLDTALDIFDQELIGRDITAEQREQIDRVLRELLTQLGETKFADAVAELEAGKTIVAETMLRQLYEEQQKNLQESRLKQAKVARDYAAVRVVSNAGHALELYEEATRLDPESIEGFFGLGDAALIGGTLSQAKQAFDDALRLSLFQSDRRNLALAHSKLGDVQTRLGDLEAALREHRSSLDLRQVALEQSEDDPELMRDLGLSLGKVGDAYRRQGKLQAALASYEQCRVLRQQIAAIDASNTQWQKDLSAIFERIGIARSLQGDHETAIIEQQKSLRIRQELAALEPNVSEWQDDLITSHTIIGNLHRAMGEFSSSQTSYEVAYRFAERLEKTDPSNSRWQRLLSISHISMGDLRLAQDDVDGALDRYLRSLQIRRGLTKRDPENARWQRDLAVSLTRVGDVQRSQEDYLAAAKSYGDSLEIRIELASRDPNNAQWQRDLSFGLNKVADIDARLGNFPSAKTGFETSAHIADTLTNRFPDNPQYKTDLEYIQRRVDQLETLRLQSTDAL